MKNKNIQIVQNTFQQGDLLLRKIESLPQGERKTIAQGRCVLAHGESGHSHVIEETEAELIQIGERMLLQLPSAAPVQHEEHGHKTLSPGIWEVGRVREFDWLTKMTRRVID